MRFRLVVVTVALATAAMSQRAPAGTTITSFSVSVNVVSSCQNSLSFSPVSEGRTAQIVSNTPTVKVLCKAPTPYNVERRAATEISPVITRERVPGTDGGSPGRKRAEVTSTMEAEPGTEVEVMIVTY